MRILIPILILIVFSVGAISIASCFVVPMNIVTKVSVVLSGFVNIVLAIELINSIAMSNNEEDLEDQEEAKKD